MPACVPPDPQLDYPHHSMLPEFGSFADNTSAFNVATHYLRQGDIDLARTILIRLKWHIVRFGDAKSHHWLLGPVRRLLQAIHGRRRPAAGWAGAAR